MFKVNEAHKKKHNKETIEFIEMLRWTSMEHDEIEDVAEDIVDYFCKWMENIINKIKK